jgi:topoisomerase (DNA) II binding protein 1
VYLAGFKDNEEEKLRRILIYGGAIKFTELNDSVTHVIVGNPSKNDLNNIKMAHHV